MTVKLNSNEVVLKAGDTNQVIDNNTIEGKLIVTNQRIYFKTMNAGTRNPPKAIPTNKARKQMMIV